MFVRGETTSGWSLISVDGVQWDLDLDITGAREVQHWQPRSSPSGSDGSLLGGGVAVLGSGAVYSGFPLAIAHITWKKRYHTVLLCNARTRKLSETAISFYLSKQKGKLWLSVGSAPLAGCAGGTVSAFPHEHDTANKRRYFRISKCTTSRRQERERGWRRIPNWSR